MTWTIQPRSEGPGRLRYWSVGTGPALVLIHGVGLRAEAWGAVMPLLAAQFTVYAVDMPGHGASPLGGTRTLTDYTDRIATFVRALNGPRTVAGHSMGALIALDLTISYPETVHSVMALNAIFERTADAAKAVERRAASLRDTGPADPAPTLERWFGTKPFGAEKAAVAACRSWLSHADPQGYAQAYRVFAQNDGPNRAALAQMTTPALFMTGANDPNSTPAMSRAMAGLVPEGHAEILEGAAHMAPMTHPHAVANALLDHTERATP